ncbi:MAG: hypothetical protein PUG43_04895 [Clostridiales bacterium]|nr:hypothetical protein [Clostridiales bacterium]
MTKNCFADTREEKLLYERYRLLFGEFLLNLILYVGIWILVVIAESLVSALVFAVFAFALNIFVITPAYKQLRIKSLKFDNKFLTAFTLCWIVVMIAVIMGFHDRLPSLWRYSLILMTVFVPSLIRDIYRIAKLKSAHRQQMSEEGLLK